MEALILYPLVLTAVGLMLAGIFGAMPVFARHHQPQATASGGLNLTLSSSVGMIDPGRLVRRGLPFVPGWSKRPNRVEHDPRQTQSETEVILTGLFTEVDSLRSELEGLRHDLSALIEAASHEAGRKVRPKADVPGNASHEGGEVRQRRLVRA